MPSNPVPAGGRGTCQGSVFLLCHSLRRQSTTLFLPFPSEMQKRQKPAERPLFAEVWGDLDELRPAKGNADQQFPDLSSGPQSKKERTSEKHLTTSKTFLRGSDIIPKPM